jgi:hypothetical protein
LRITCLHGYFKFHETRAGEISKWASRYGFDMVRIDDYFTFKQLEAAPDFSLQGLPYLGAVTTETFAGRPWEVMEANGLVFNFALGLVVPITSVTVTFRIDQAGNYFLSPGLILPGSVKVDGSRVKDYAAWFSFDTLKFRYSEVGYV